MSIVTVGCECYPVLLTVWQGARLAPVSQSVWPAAVPLTKAIMPQGGPVLKGVGDPLIPDSKRWISPFLFIWQCVKKKKKVKMILTDFPVLLLWWWECQIFSLATMRRLRRNGNKKVGQRSGQSKATTRRFKVLNSLKRLLENEQIAHEWQVLFPNFPGDLCCAVKANDNKIQSEWSSVKGMPGHP